MEKSKLYTATGDQGTTSLVGGRRVKKNSVRIEAYGTCDEFSAFLGAIAASNDCPAETRRHIEEVQVSLFDIGGYLACDSDDEKWQLPSGITDAKIARIESWIDTLDAAVPKINSFILPGGTSLAAKAHIARTVCRRAERRILDLADRAEVDPNVLRYFNRLSDWLFVAARYFNMKEGAEEVVYRGGA